MSVWQTPQPTTWIVTSSGERSPRVASAQSNWPLATNLRPLLVAGTEPARCAGRGVVTGILLPPQFRTNVRNNMPRYLLGEIEDVIAITSSCDSRSQAGQLPARERETRAGTLDQPSPCTIPFGLVVRAERIRP